MPATTHCDFCAALPTPHSRSETVAALPVTWLGCRSTWTGNRGSWLTPALKRLLRCGRRLIGSPTNPCRRRRSPRHERGAPATATPGPSSWHRAVQLATDAGDGALECAALDHVCSVCSNMDRPREAGSAIERRLQLIRTLPIGAAAGFELLDTLQVASDIDALAGRFDDVVHNAERFRTGWERGGRRAATGLAKAAYSAAMAHGMLGDDTGSSCRTSGTRPGR